MIEDIEIIEPIRLRFKGSFNVFNDNELFEFCAENNKLHIERTSEGELIFMSPMGGDSAYREYIIFKELSYWDSKQNLGYIFSSTVGFTLPNQAMRSPDPSFIPTEKWLSLPKDNRKKFAHICPDL